MREVKDIRGGGEAPLEVARKGSHCVCLYEGDRIDDLPAGSERTRLTRSDYFSMFIYSKKKKGEVRGEAKQQGACRGAMFIYFHSCALLSKSIHI